MIESVTTLYPVLHSQVAKEEIGERWEEEFIGAASIGKIFAK